ncbi:phage integrase N-terminal SAM-like domain-containing protein [Moritella yayanosii]|uniref:phage integrase N-terminal SAM-like domain-containing protein n=1 Tax=Moritella yayanosii TaxID=69539 RepID=UPI001E4B5C8B|nr:phage integrase N-terminal SAM-like domain-containing protein [Moritella yayanosii]
MRQLRQLLQQFNEEITLRGYSERTRNSYRYVINQLYKYFGQPFDTISDKQLEMYFRYFNLEKHHCRATLKLHLNGIHFCLSTSYIAVLLSQFVRKCS